MIDIRKIFNNLKKDRLTIMVIPHSAATPKTISIPTKYLYISLLLFLVVFLLALLIIMRNLNYINTVQHNILLENKLEYFSNQLVKNRNFLSEVRDVDYNLRKMLGMKNNQAVLDYSAVGGPQVIDEIIASKFVNNKMALSVAEFSSGLDLMNKDIVKQLKSSKEILKYISAKQKMESSTPNIWPAIGHISSPFGYRVHPITGRLTMHSGIDISSRIGSSVVSSADGVVIYAGVFGGYGKLIMINHGYGYVTYYAHLYKILVSKGTKVKKRDKIGLIGNTGLSTGPHLHYEVKYKNIPQNPLKYLYKNKKINNN